MKIIKHGNKIEKKKEKFEDFKCDKCGCEFSLKEDEYYVDKGGKDMEDNENAYSVTISAYINDYFVCSCPECHKIVKKVNSRLNKNYCDSSITLKGVEGNINSVTYDNPDIQKNLTCTWTNEDVLSEIMKV